MNLFVYDLECYPNFFSIIVDHPTSSKRWVFEISERLDQSKQIRQLLGFIKDADGWMVGYNNVGYDYPMIHTFLMKADCTYKDLYAKNKAIFATPWEDRFDHHIPEYKMQIKQIDLYLIHHFDNAAKSVSLKDLEFALQMDSIQVLPIEPCTHLTIKDMDDMLKYQHHDVDATKLFLEKSMKMIEARVKYTEKFDIPCMNYNDTKIGEKYFIKRLESHNPDYCYIQDPTTGKKKPRQTPRPVIDLKDAVLSWIEFETPEFQKILEFFKSKKVKETKGVFKKLNCTVNGFQFDFGLGGIHGSRKCTVVATGNGKTLVDKDVASYYPNLAITQRLYPAHLGEEFCDIYEGVYQERKKYPKSMSENGMFKLALNGVYGKSNSKYSPFYDPLYTMTICINGQLLLCKLAEMLFKIPDLELIQVNTDGLTVLCPDEHLDWMAEIHKEWEKLTGLTLEDVIYDKMFVRDVNSYIAVGVDGYVKRKGTYEYDLEWHKDFSQRVVAKVAEEFLLNGGNIWEMLQAHPHDEDFFLRAKVKGKDKLLYNGEPVQKIARFYAGIVGGDLKKVAPPAGNAKVGTWKRASGITDDFYKYCIGHPPVNGELVDADGMPWDERIHTKNMSKHEIRETEFISGYHASLSNDSIKIDRDNLDYFYYMNEVFKIVKGFIK